MSNNNDISLYISMFKIGNIEIDGKVALAPMAGFTSSGYREFFERFGIAFSYTEMISDMGLIYGNKETIDYLPNKISKFPVGIQLFGSEPENLLKAAKIAINLAKQVDFIDINMACPVPKVNKTGAGSSLLKNPKKCGDIIRILKQNLSLLITAKIRMGWDDNNLNYLEVIKELELAGVDMIAIHARTRKDLYSGEARFNELKDLGLKTKVPLLISGNIFTLDDAIKALSITKASGVLVARGGIGNPYLVKQIDTYFRQGIRLSDATLNDYIGWCLRLAQYLIKEKGETRAMTIYRSMAPKFFSNLPNVKSLKTRLASELVSYNSLKEIILDYLNDNIPDFKLEIWDLYKRDLTNDEHLTMIRGELPTEGYYHIVTDIVIEHNDGTFLLMKRDYKKHRGGMYEFTCGGSAVKNESPIEAAKRELKEETGIRSDKLIQIGFEIDDIKQGLYYEYYVKDNFDKDNIRLQPGETIGYVWVDKNTLLELIRTHQISNKRILKYLDEININ